MPKQINSDTIRKSEFMNGKQKYERKDVNCEKNTDKIADDACDCMLSCLEFKKNVPHMHSKLLGCTKVCM